VLQALFNDFLTLFVVIDPIGIVPIFLALVRHLPKAQRRRTAFRGVMIAGVILLLFVFGGEFLLKAIGVTMPSFRVAGGVILFLFGLQMVFGSGESEAGHDSGPETGYDPAVYPVAIPSIAGPGAMLAVTELAQTSSATSLGKPITAGLLVLVLLITWAMLAAADVILNLIGRTGANAVSRVLGILLTGVAVEFVVSGIRGLVH